MVGGRAERGIGGWVEEGQIVIFLSPESMYTRAKRSWIPFNFHILKFVLGPFFFCLYIHLSACISLPLR